MSEGDEETIDEHWEWHFYAKWAKHFRDYYDDEEGWRWHYRGLDPYGQRDYPQHGSWGTHEEYDRSSWDYEQEVEAWWETFIEDAADEYSCLCDYREHNMAAHRTCLAEFEKYAISGEDGPQMDLPGLASIVVARAGDPDNEGYFSELPNDELDQLRDRDRVTDAIHTFLEAVEKLAIPALDLDQLVAHVAFEVEVRRNKATPISHGRAYLLELDRRGRDLWCRLNPGKEPKRTPWRDERMFQLARDLNLAKDGSKGRLTNVLSKIGIQIRALGPVGVYARAFARENRVLSALKNDSDRNEKSSATPQH